MNDILLETLHVQTGKTVEELQELLYEKLDEQSEELTLKSNAKDLILELDAQRVEVLKQNTNKEWESKVEKIKRDQEGKGKKDALKELENALITEFEVDAKDKKGLDLIKAIIATQTKSSMTVDDVKKHPAYLELETRISKEFVPKSDYEEIKSTHEKYISDQERHKRLSIVRNKALEVFRNTKPRLSEDANIRANQEEMFLRVYVDDLNVDTSNDNMILLNGDGNRLEDKHGNAVNLAKHIEEITRKNFDILVQQPGGGAGNKNESGNGKVDALKKPETEDEYNRTRSTLSGKELIDYSDKYGQLFKD